MKKITRCPTCGQLTTNRKHCDRRPTTGRRRCKLYDTQRWRKSSAAMIRKDPICNRCPMPSAEVHHVHGHDCTPRTFYAGPFECLCKSCHAKL